MKGVIALFGVGFFIMFLGLAIMPALSSFRGQEVTEPHNISSGNTTANIVLANSVLDDNKVNITVYSPEATDAPVAYEFVKATKTVTINGLDSGVARQVSIVYLHTRLDGATDAAARFFPAFLIIVGIAIVGGAGFETVKNARGG